MAVALRAVHCEPHSEPRELEDFGDDELMMLAKAGRQDAFETLVRRHQQLVYGIAARFLGNNAAGRDVAQDVFLALWADRRRFRCMGRFRSYLVSMTLHRCHVLVRRSKCHSRCTSSMAEEDQAEQTATSEIPLDALVERERAREVRSMLVYLTEKQREIIILRFTNNMGLQEIASSTGIPVNTVKSHLLRGLRRLHGLLSKGDA